MINFFPDRQLPQEFQRPLSLNHGFDYFDPLQVIVRGTFFLKVLGALGCFVFRLWGPRKVDCEKCHRILCHDHVPLPPSGAERREVYAMSVGRKCLERGPGAPTRPLSWRVDKG